MLNEFLWHGKNRLAQSVCYQDYPAGGLRMLKVQDSVMSLRVKWMQHLWKDKGATWSVYIWNQVLASIPEAVIPGMTYVSDAWICDWDPFYQDIIRAFVNLNVLACGVPLDKQLPKNLWACQENRVINIPLVKAGIVEVVDLPLVHGTVDFHQLQDLSKAQGSKQSVFLIASALQNKFKSWFHIPVSDRNLQMEPIKKIKTILHMSNWKQSTLTKWEVALQITPLLVTEFGIQKVGAKD